MGVNPITPLEGGVRGGAGVAGGGRIMKTSEKSDITAILEERRF